MRTLLPPRCFSWHYRLSIIRCITTRIRPSLERDVRVCHRCVSLAIGSLPYSLSASLSIVVRIRCSTWPLQPAAVRIPKTAGCARSANLISIPGSIAPLQDIQSSSYSQLSLRALLLASSKPHPPGRNGFLPPLQMRGYLKTSSAANVATLTARCPFIYEVNLITYLGTLYPRARDFAASFTEFKESKTTQIPAYSQRSHSLWIAKSNTRDWIQYKIKLDNTFSYYLYLDL